MPETGKEATNYSDMKKWKILAVCALLCGCSSAGSETEANAGSAQPSDYACRVINYYDYSKPVPESAPADDAYYADSFFGGDSRMGGLYLYGTEKYGEIYYTTSLNLFLIDSMAVNDYPDETMLSLLEKTDKKHIYLMMGINEIRQKNFDAWADAYQELIDQLKEEHPDADIYLIATYHPREISGLDDDELDVQLEKVNTKIRELAENNLIYYIDLDPGITDETGLMRTDYTWDGLHMTPSGARAVEAYIKKHVYRRSEYVKEICE